MSTGSKKRGLGRGLGDLGLTALLKETAEDASPAEGALKSIALNRIHPGPFQPRKSMDPALLDELAQSIRAQGVIQPIVLRLRADQHYELIAGERRWRAAQRAGLKTIPAVVREVNDQAMMAMGVIENIQRADLNAIESAQALARLIHEFGLTHEAVAQAIGYSRVRVTNLLRLLKLNEAVQSLVINGDLDMGQARALLALPEDQQEAVANQIIDQGLSVRQTEQLVKRMLSSKNPAQLPCAPEVNTEALAEKLSTYLSVPVAFKHRASGKGVLQIHYHSVDELQGVLDKINIQTD